MANSNLGKERVVIYEDQNSADVCRMEQAGTAAANDITPQSQYNAISKEHFKGCFDPEAQYSCSIAKFYGRVGSGPAYDTNANGSNYILYKNHIYFLCDKAFIENGTVDPWKDSGCVVFGAINLSTYRVEIIKEYPSIGFIRKLRSNSQMVISVSHDKIWYITYLHDDAEQDKADPGNLAVKCLDINTRVESVVLELPKKAQVARLPIVMGNVITYIQDGNLVCHNLATGVTDKRQCVDILGYNSSYIFFTKKRECEITDFYMLDVSNGEVTLVRKYIKEALGIKNTVKRIYYIDCKNNAFYAEIGAERVSRGGRTSYIIGGKTVSSPDLNVIVSCENKSVEVIEPYGTKAGGYEFLWYMDGRSENEAFDGCQYRMTYKIKSGGMRDGCYYLVRIERNGEDGFMPCDCESSSMASNVLVALGDAAIAQTAPGTVYLYHKGKWMKIFS